ncbi:MAG TPA: alpha/beta hydrolase [Bryobacteraceae bacterium]|nr:alpha/beta hydrolase [Bryobacteraceae bacterium]
MNQEQRLRAFRAAYPNKSLAAGGVEWKYRVCGNGSRPMLLLPGGELVNDMAFDLAAALAPQFRMAYPAYPRVASLDDLADGVAAILRAENAVPATVLGASFGGAVAQCLIRRHPDCVERLILSNTGVPLGYLVRGRKIANAVLSAMPWPILRGLLSRSILKLLGAPAGELPFWRAYTQELFETQLTKADVLQNLAIQLEYHQRYRFAPGDLAGWPGMIFVIESDNDIFNAERRKALRDIYPQAPVYTFHGAGHAPAFSRASEYLDVLGRFLA